MKKSRNNYILWKEILMNDIVRRKEPEQSFWERFLWNLWIWSRLVTAAASLVTALWKQKN